MASKATLEKIWKKSKGNYVKFAKLTWQKGISNWESDAFAGRKHKIWKKSKKGKASMAALKKRGR